MYKKETLLMVSYILHKFSNVSAVRKVVVLMVSKETALKCTFC